MSAGTDGPVEAVVAKRIERLRDALRPFAGLDVADTDREEPYFVEVNIDDVVKARQALRDWQAPREGWLLRLAKWFGDLRARWGGRTELAEELFAVEMRLVDVHEDVERCVRLCYQTHKHVTGHEYINVDAAAEGLRQMITTLTTDPADGEIDLVEWWVCGAGCILHEKPTGALCDMHVREWERRERKQHDG